MRSTLLSVLSILFTLTAHGQGTVCDLVTRRFVVGVENDVLYGTALRFDGGTDSLRLNIFKPIGDDNSARPLLIAIHGGAFVGGNRNEMNDLCRWYAERGYVAATISYRLGFYTPPVLPVPYTYDESEVIRAAFRAQQDAKGAIRFLRARYVQDSTSTENVVVLGVSAGGIAALHVAYATEPNEKPAACGAIAPVEHPGAQYPRPDLGSIDGDLNPGESTAVVACVSYLGAMLDTAIIGSASDPALFTYHQNGDPIVPCGYQQALWGAPLGMGTNYPWLFGSCSLPPHMAQVGFTATRYEAHEYTGNEHAIHDIPLVDGWTAEFLERQLCNTATGLTSSGSGPEVEVYPLPVSEVLTVRHGITGTTQLQLLTMDGRTLSRAVGTTLAVGDVAAGSYLLNIRAGGQQWVRHVVVAH